MSQAASNAGLRSFQGLNLAPQNFNFMDMLKNIGGGMSDMFKSDGFGNALKFGSLALSNKFGNESLDIANKQVGILGEQENRAATAQNLNTGHNLSLALQTTTPGTPEHARIVEAIQNQTFQV